MAGETCLGEVMVGLYLFLSLHHGAPLPGDSRMASGQGSREIKPRIPPANLSLH